MAPWEWRGWLRQFSYGRTGECELKLFDIGAFSCLTSEQKWGWSRRGAFIFLTHRSPCCCFFCFVFVFVFIPNLVPRVLRLFGQRVVARRDSGVLEFYYRRISAVKQCKPLQSSQSQNLNFFEFSRVSPGPTRWPKSLRTLGTRLSRCQSLWSCGQRLDNLKNCGNENAWFLRTRNNAKSIHKCSWYSVFILLHV